TQLQFRLPSSIIGPSGAEPTIVLRGQDARWQLQVASTASADTISSRDVTREVTYTTTPPDIVYIDPLGLVTPVADGTTTLTASLGEQSTQALTVVVSGMQTTQPVNFPNQIVPLFTKFGCNGGGCHGKAA